MLMLPRRISRNPQRAKCPPVIGDIGREDRIALVEARRADLIRIIPSMPCIAGAILFCFPAQIGLLRLADGKSALADKLRVPFRKAEVPRHFGAAKLALAVIPAA